MASSVDSSCADESDDGEFSSYAGSSSLGDTSDSEPLSPPHSPLSKSDAVLNGLNSEVDVGLAVGIAGASAGNSVGLKTASVVGVAKVAMVDSPAVNVLVVPPPFCCCSTEA
uniref:Uncharacterized protein n=1 Tax=Salix viminalis TaxID=40686 RepID=A0A6N2K474_SALVM